MAHCLRHSRSAIPGIETKTASSDKMRQRMGQKIASGTTPSLKNSLNLMHFGRRAQEASLMQRRRAKSRRRKAYCVGLKPSLSSIGRPLIRHFSRERFAGRRRRLSFVRGLFFPKVSSSPLPPPFKFRITGIKSHLSHQELNEGLNLCATTRRTFF